MIKEKKILLKKKTESISQKCIGGGGNVFKILLLLAILNTSAMEATEARFTFYNGNLYILDDTATTNNNALIAISSNNTIPKNSSGTFTVTNNALFSLAYTNIDDSSLGIKTVEITNNSSSITKYVINSVRYYNVSNYINKFQINAGETSNKTATVYTGISSKDGLSYGVGIPSPFTITNNDDNTTLDVQNKMTGSSAILTLDGSSTKSATVECYYDTFLINNVTGVGATTAVKMSNYKTLTLGGTATTSAVKINTRSTIVLDHTADRAIDIDPNSKTILNLKTTSANNTTLKLLSGKTNTIETVNLLFTVDGDKFVDFFDFFPTTKLTLGKDSSDAVSFKTKISHRTPATFSFGKNPSKDFVSKINLLLNYNDSTNTKIFDFDTFPGDSGDYGISIENITGNGDKKTTIVVPSGNYVITKDGVKEYKIASSPLVTDYTIEDGKTILIQHGIAPEPVPEPEPKPEQQLEPGQQQQEPITEQPPALEPTGDAIIDNLPTDIQQEFSNLPVEVQGALMDALSIPDMQAAFVEAIALYDGLPPVEILELMARINNARLQAIMDASFEEIMMNLDLLSTLFTITEEEFNSFRNFSPAQKAPYLRSKTTTSVLSKANKNNQLQSKMQNKIKRLSFKDRIWQILHTDLDQYHLDIYNKLSCDIRNLLYINSSSLIKFGSLDKKQVVKFSKLSPIDQLNYSLKNLNVFFVKKSMKSAVQQLQKSESQSNLKQRTENKNILFV